MERVLASIQIISSLDKIEGADFIERATIMGWTCVVKKGEFKVGDKCIFCEIDSILPDKPWSEFLRPRGFRVKTIRLRGCLSQGVAFPTSILLNSEEMEIGTDVGELLGITKYNPPEPQERKTKGNFPSIIPKTDEIRIQSCLGVIDEIKGKNFYITVKLDGTSFTCGKRDSDLFVCSRNLELKEANNDYWRMVKKYNLNEILPDNFAIQAELCGPSWLKNRLKLSEPDIFVFNVFDIKNGKYLDYYDYSDFCEIHGLKRVPLERIVFPKDGFDFSLENWLKIADGKYENTNNFREGIVIRPLVETYSNVLKGRLSFKVISNKYLLKNE